jgi:RHS repeat-associated protein
MIERLRALVTMILCFVMATSPLQAPAVDIYSASINRSTGWDVNVSSLPAEALSSALEHQMRAAAILNSANQQFSKSAQVRTKDLADGGKYQSYSGQTTTLLPDGRLLLLGGRSTAQPVALAFIKNPTTGVVTQLTQGMQHARYAHSATLLPDGTVLILGGFGADGKVERVAELFDPSSLAFTTISTTGIAPRAFHTATVLTDGRILVAGGVSASGEVVGLLEFWDLKSMLGRPSESGLIVARGAHTATLRSDGSVLFWGGIDSNGSALDYGEVYDPVNGSSRMQPTLPAVDNSGPPIVEASIPADGEDNVPLGTSIGVRFSRPLQVESLNTDTVTLSNSDGNIQARVVPVEGGMLVFLKPSGGLAGGTTYTLSLSNAVDRSGSTLIATTISFTTAGATAGGQNGIATGNAISNGSPFDSPWRRLPPLYAPPGVTAVSGQALQLNGEPLKNILLQIGKVSTWTDRTGRFLLKNVHSGHQVMWINGHSANTSHVSYGSYEDGVDIKAGQTNVLNYTIWMTALDTAHAVTITSPTVGETVITNPFLPGLELHLPPRTVIYDWYGKPVTQVSITPIPIAQPPFPLPAGVQVPIYFTIQPGGAYLQGYGKTGFQGASLFYPNPQHLHPGTVFNFWNYDADQKGWYVYGQGSVAADARQVIPNPGVVIYEFTGAMVGNPPAPASGPLPGSGPQKAGEPVDLQTGLFVYTKTDLSLPDVVPLQVTRTYRQMDPTSRNFGIGTTLNYDMFLLGDTYPYTYMDLVLGDGGRVHFDRVSSGTSYTDAVYKHATSPTGFYGAQIVWNGGGWNLTLKNGTQYTFPDCYSTNTPQQCAPIRMTDRNRNTVTYQRDSNSNLTQVTSPNGRWIKFTYDTSNRIQQATDNGGRSVYYNYDTLGRLSTVQDVNGGTTTFGYDVNNNMTTIQDARQITYLTNYYDANNMVYKQVLGDGASTYLFGYVGVGLNGACSVPCPISGSSVTEADVTDPRGNVRKVHFNSDGYMSSQTFAAGTSVQGTTTYNRLPGSGLILSTTDALNRNTYFTYDAMGNITSVTQLGGTSNAVTTLLDYQSQFAELTSVTDALGRTTSFSYDQIGNLVRTTDPSGFSVLASYNLQGQPVSITDPVGNAFQFSYRNGDLVTVTDTLGRSIASTRDEVGRPVEITDPTGQTTQFAWNPFNLVTSVADSEGNTTNLTWDPNGHLQSLQDANQHTTSYTYDNLDRLATRTDPLLATESFQYDGNDNLIQFTDRRGVVNTYSYDALNRLSFIGYGAQPGPTYQSTTNISYDGGDRPTSIVDSLAGTITPTFNGLDRLTAEVTAQGSVGYQYDAVGRRSSMTVAGQPQVNYNYDNSDRLTQIAQGSSSVSLGYDPDSRRTSLTLPNGVSVSYGYDQASRLTSMTYQSSAGQLGSLGYAYDQASRVSQISGSFARTGLPVALSLASYDAANRLTNWAGTAYSYDANGNLTNDGVNTYTWDARNQLSSISGGVSASFQYDALGRRAGKTIGGVATNFLYDRANTVQELSGSTPTANFLTGGLDEIFTRTTTGVETFLSDQLGSTVATTDSTGALATQYTYEPFGNTSSTGSITSNAFQYTGRENDRTGLYFSRARYYSPRLQRFISQDPIGFGGGSANLYAYTFNSPTNFSDPSGNDPWQLAGAGGVGTFIAASQFVPGWDVALDSALVLGAAGLGAVALSKDLASTLSRSDPLAQAPPISTPMDPGRGPSQDPGKNDPCHPSNFDKYAQSASDPYNSNGPISNAARALQKHAGRGQGFPTPFGSPADMNSMAQELIEEILTNPGSQCTTGSTPRQGKYVQVQLPSGLGARWNPTGGFIGLVGP